MSANDLTKVINLIRYRVASLFLDQTYHLDVIISGVPKSGTTWLGYIFGSLPNLHIEMEGGSYSPEKTLREVFLNSDDFSLGDEKVVKAMRDFKKFALRRAYLRNKTRIGYKAPQVNPQALYALFPEVPVIYIYRDGRDFIVSDAFHNLRLGRIAGDPETDQFWQEAILRRAPFWAGMIQKNLGQFRAVYRDQLIEIKYEDLLGPSGDEILVNLCGRLGYARQDVEKAWNQNTFNRLSGGRKPGDEDPQSFFRKGVAGDWQNYFSDANHDLFLEIAGAALTYAGYRLRMENART